MATFLDKLFGNQTAGFLSSLFGGGKGAIAATPKPSFAPRQSRLTPVLGALQELLAPHPPQTGVLPTVRVESIIPAQQIPVIVEEDFLQPDTEAEPKPQEDALSGYEPKTQAWLRSGDWLHVFSSNVSALRYLWPAQNLQVEYLDGAIYEYYGVEPAVAVDFTYALSPGRYRWHVLGDPRWGTTRYDYKRIKEGRKGARPAPRVAREQPNYFTSKRKKRR
jgi:hypothetical protein